MQIYKRAIGAIAYGLAGILGACNAGPIDQGGAEDISVRRGALTTATAGLFIPTYYDADDNSSWDKALAASSSTPFYVLNPADGPGSSFDPAFAGWSAYIHETGQLVIGYLEFVYDTPTSTITQQIDNYVDWYRVDGIFFDDAFRYSYQSDLSKVSWLIDYTTSKSGWNTNYLIPIFNWGTIPPEQVVSCSIGRSNLTKIVDFEDTESVFSGTSITDAFSTTTVPWLYTYKPTHFVQLIYGASSTSATSLLATMRTRNAAYAYITDRTYGNNPWLAPASTGLWDSEKNAYSEEPPFTDFGGSATDPSPPSNCPSANTCDHDLCFSSGTSDPLAASCDSCVNYICNAVDGYCCSTDWDDMCVGEAVSYCSLSCS